MSRNLPFEDAAIERQTALIRYAEGKAKTINPVLLAIIDYLTTRIPKEGELITTKKDLDQLIKDVTARLDKEFTGWENGQFLPMFKDVIETELEFDQSATEAIVDDYTAAVPPAKKVESAAFLNPLVINAGAEAVMFDKYIKDWKPYQINRVIGTIRGGFATGMTTQQIVRDICGTKSAKYRDGALNKTRADIQGMVHTTVQHLASTARNEFSQQNKDLIIGMRDIATLDVKTSGICKARDQTVYLFEKYGKNHPSPPYHRRSCVAGTMITTDSGLVAIEDVKVGDNVLTHTGRYMPATEVMGKLNTGILRTLVDNLGRSISLTHEHPVLTVSGWKRCVDLEVGDVLFNNAEKFPEFDCSVAPRVANGVLLDSHNIVTETTEDLVSFGIFSRSLGVSSSIELNSCISNDEVGYEYIPNDMLEFVFNATNIESIDKDRFVKGRIELVVNSSRVDGFDFCLPIVNGIISLHSIARLFGCFFSSFGLQLAPVHVALSGWSVLLAGLGRLRSVSSFDAKLDASLSDVVVRESILSLDVSKAFAFLPMIYGDDVKNFFICKNQCESPNSMWFNTSITSIVDYTDIVGVYNMSVAEDETYVADGVLVHNCRTTQVYEFSSEYDFLKEGRKRPAVFEGKAEQVGGTRQYYDILKNQPAAVQDDALGKTKGKIFRNAGLTPEEFKQATVDQFYRELTLDEMAAKNKKIAAYLKKLKEEGKPTYQQKPKGGI